MRLRQFCGFSSSGGPGWALAPPDALGMELEGHWCLKVANLGMLGFFLRADGASPLPVFDRRVPLRFARETFWGTFWGIGGVVGIARPPIPRAGLSQTQPVGKSVVDHSEPI